MIISLIFFLVIIFGLGLPLVLFINPKSSLLIKIGVSFPIGTGVFTILMFVTNYLGLKFSLLNESLLLAALSLPLVYFGRKKLKDFFIKIPSIKKLSKLQTSEKVMLGIMGFLIICSFMNTFFWPVYMWDSVVLYDYRAHVFSATGFMKDVFINEYYFSYPLLTSLGHTIVYLSGGKYPQFIYSLFYLSLGISFFGLLREFVSRKAGLFYTMLLMIIGQIFYHSLFSYTNLAYTVYLGLGAILIYVWYRKMTIGYLVLSALLIGFSLHIRSTEPFWIALLLLVVIISLYTKKFVGLFLYTLIVIPLRQMWISYQDLVSSGGVISFTNKIESTRIISELVNFDRWGQIATYLYKYMIAPQALLFALFVLSCFLLLLSKRKEHLIMFVITFLFIGVLVVGTFMFSIYLDYWYRIGDATERLSMLFYPILVYSIALVISDSIKHN